MEMGETLLSGLVQALIGLLGVGVGAWFAWRGEQSRARASRRFDIQNRQHEGMNTLLDEMEALHQAYKTRAIAKEANKDTVEDPVQLGICAKRSREIIERAKRYAFDESVTESIKELDLIYDRNLKVAEGYRHYLDPADNEAPPTKCTHVGLFVEAIGSRIRPPELSVPPRPQPTSEQLKNVLTLDRWLASMVLQARECAAVARREIKDHVAEPKKGNNRVALFSFLACAAIGVAVFSTLMVLT